MPNQLWLQADIGEVIGAILAVLVPLLWVIKQITDAAKQGKPDDALQPAPPQAPEPRAARPAAGQQADPLRNQVEEFLRRAGRGAQAERPRAPVRDIEVLVGEALTTPAAEVPRPAEMPPAARRTVVPRKRKSLAERATERAAARASKMAELSSHLGQRIIEDDQQFDIQLKARFDHTVGSLTGSAVTAAEQAAAAVTASETPAAQIAAMLATPDGVRQAIVVNEILRRPIDRW
jgi:hypothetical protein